MSSFTDRPLYPQHSFSRRLDRSQQGLMWTYCGTFSLSCAYVSEARHGSLCTLCLVRCRSIQCTRLKICSQNVGFALQVVYISKYLSIQCTRLKICTQNVGFALQVVYISKYLSIQNPLYNSIQCHLLFHT